MRTLSATEAAERLGIKPATLYAYVSRGLLQSRPGPDRRHSSFDAAEVERLASRKPGGRRSAHDLVIASDITVIEAQGHRYRGHRAADLVASGARFEQVAELLWTGQLPEAVPRWPVASGVAVTGAAQASLPPEALLIDRQRMVVTAAAASDPFRYDIRPEAVAARAAGIVALLVDGLPSAGQARSARARARVRPAEPLAARLWPRLTRLPASPARLAALDGALVLLADHELAASTVAVRIAGAYRADPYSAVLAGLGVMSGARHGGASLGAEDLLSEIVRTGDAARAVGERLRAGELIHGFGQPLYPDGDPRFGTVVELARGAARDKATFSALDDIVAVGVAQHLPLPNVDLGMAAFGRTFQMRRGSAEAIFSVARTAGWLAHLTEEYEQPTRFRLRAIAR